MLKALVLLGLLGATAYLALDRGSFEASGWMPVAMGSFAAVVITLFVSRYYEDVPRSGWLLVAALGLLVGVKALSMIWTLSQSETIQEVLRSSMYLAFFLLVLAALSSERQVTPMMDIAALIVVAVAGYGLFQKIYPLDYPVASLDGVRMDSTLGYSNTTATVIGMGFALVLGRMTSSSNIAFRGVSAALLLAFATAGYLTVSRGGIIALALALVVMLLLTEGRLQMLFNLTLVGIPTLWLFFEMQGLPGLLGANLPDEARVSDGITLRNLILIALLAAFLLQVIYSFFYKRYELAPFGRRVVGIGVAVLAGIAAIAGAVLLIFRSGGISAAVSTLTSDPSAQSENAVSRLASLSIGFRADYWATAWEYWQSNFFTGSGAGTFSYVWLEFRGVDTGVQQVHNLYLEQGVETGIFAFLALAVFTLGLVFYVARATFHAEGRRRRVLAGLLGALVVYLSSSVIEWHWYIPASTMLFFVLAAIAVKYSSMKEPLKPGPAYEEGDSTADLEARLSEDAKRGA